MRTSCSPSLVLEPSKVRCKTERGHRHLPSVPGREEGRTKYLCPPRTASRISDPHYPLMATQGHHLPAQLTSAAAGLSHSGHLTEPGRAGETQVMALGWALRATQALLVHKFKQ